MNKYFLYAASVLALASCSSDDFLGENSGNGQNAANSVINFGGETGKITRAADGKSVGASAAKLLGKKFYVLGTKGTLPKTNPTETIVFDNYQVNWKENSAGTTTDNTNDWEYVGVDPMGLHAGTAAPTAQSIKFWDYSQPQYDFIAYSVGNNELLTTGDAVAGKILGTEIKTPKANAVTAADNYLSYTLKGKRIQDLKECYYTDVTTVVQDNYKKPVTFTFKNLTAKVRVAFYETIPGYTVSDIQFYENTTAPKADLTDKGAAVLFTTGDYKLSTNGEIKVTYPKVGSENASDAAYNKAFVSVVKGTDDETTTLGLGNVNYDNGVLNDNAKKANMAGTADNSYFTPVLPAEGHALTLRLNYTLTSTDGSNEKIKVYGATAVVPDSYTAWQPNYAYTYIFKISDNTNGTTSTTTDKEGLFPITFDAVVADVDNADFSHESITTVATPSVTTYAFNSHDKKVIKAYGVGNEYPASKNTDIYISVSEDGKTMNDLNTKGQLYSVNKAEATEAEVIDALQIRASENTTATTKTITGRNDIVLTEVGTTTVNEIPKEDGKTIEVGDNTTAKFTAETAATYAYVYLKEAGTPSAIYTAVTYAAGNEPTAGENEYYLDPSGKTAVAKDFKLKAGITYYKKYTNNNDTYGVKVVKIY